MNIKGVIIMISGISFGARLQVEKIHQFNYLLQESQKQAPLSMQVSTGTNFLSSYMSSLFGAPASKTIGVGADVTATAFLLKASEIDSFGIAPSMLNKIASSATPVTVQSSAEQPLVAGGIFSTIGEWFRYHSKINIEKPKRKIPN